MEAFRVSASLARRVSVRIKAAGNSVMGVLEGALCSKMPYIEFDNNAFSMEAALEDGPIGIFTKEWPGFPGQGIPYHVYSRKEAMAWIAALPKTEVTWRGRLFLRLQVYGSGLE